MGPSADHVNKDASKWTLILPKVMLGVLNLWPEWYNRFTTLVYWIMLFFLLTLELGQVIYFAIHITDLTVMATVMSTISPTLQAIFKTSVAYVYSRKLKKVIKMIKYEFWPSDLMGKELENDLYSYARTIVGCMVMLYVSSIIFASGFLSAPLRAGIRTLPFESWYPFDWKWSPFYEIVYAIQSVTLVHIIIVGNCGHDSLYLIICINCIAQFRLLKEITKKIGAPEGKRINHDLYTLYGATNWTAGNIEDLEERQLLIKCIRHHIKLIRLYHDINEIFAVSNVIQLLCSVAAICGSSFVIVMTGRSQVIHLTSFCLGHILQLFIYCTLANELSFQSETLASCAFEGSWYSDKYLLVKKDMLMLMQHAQQPRAITALGIVNFNYSTFLGVLRFSFSFYTFLTTIVKK